MAPQVLYRVCYGFSEPTTLQKSLLRIQPAVLHEYCRHKVIDCDYPAIIPSANDSVRGAYVHGLTDADIRRLDIFEGSEYARRKVEVQLLDAVGYDDGRGNEEGQTKVAETYIWTADEEYLEEGEWDFAEFKRDKLRDWVGRRDEFDGKYRLQLRMLRVRLRFLCVRLNKFRRDRRDL